MKVRTKLIIGFLVIVVLLWLIVLYAGTNYGDLKEQFATVEADIIPENTEMTEIERAANEAYSHCMDYILYDIAEGRQAALSEISYLEDIKGKYLPSTENLENEDYRANETLVAKIGTFNTNIITLMDYKVMMSSRDELLAWDRNTTLPSLLDLEQFVNQVKAANIEKLAVAKGNFNDAYTGGVHSLLISAVLMTFLAIIAASSTMRSITRPLHALHKGTEMIAQGNLDYKVGTKAEDEIGQLSRAFDRMTLSLKNSMTSIENLNQEIAERKRAEEALRESEEKFSKAFSASPDIISIVNLENGKFIDVNDSFTRYTGYTYEEIVGHTTAEVNIWVEAEERERILHILKEKGRVSHEEIHTRTKSGKIRVGLYSAETIHIGGTLSSITVIMDITERKRVEEALRESEEKYSSLVEHGNDGIVILQDGLIKYANSKMVEMLGYSLEEAIGKPFIDFVSQEYRGLVADNYRKRMAREETPTTYEFDIIAKDGMIIHAEVNASLLEYEGKPADMAIIRDITGRKRAQQALRESEEKFSKAFRSSPDTIAITTIKEGKYLEVNESYCRITGYSREELINRCTNEINIWAKAEDRARLFKILKEQGRVNQEEFDFRMKNGEIRTWMFSAEPINIGGEQCLIGVSTDITERKKREQLQHDENYVLTLLGQGAELSKLLDAIVRLGEEHDPSIKGSVLLYDSAKGFLIQASGPNLPDDYKEVISQGVPIGPVAGSCGTAAYLKERVIITDIENSPLFKPFEEVVKLSINNGLLSCWSQPIISSNGELLGTIANYSNKLGEPDADNLRVLEWSARIAAIAIERKQAEEALANEAIWRRNLIEQSLDGIVVLDENSKVYEANQQFVEMLGYSLEEVRELHTWDWDTQWTREELLEMGRNVDETGYHLETYWQRKDGTTIDVEISVNGAVCAGQKLIFCVCRNVTARKKAEEALREREKRFSDIAENSLEWIWEVDTEGKYTYSSPVVEEILGHKPEEVLEKHFYDFFLPEEREELKKAAFDAFAQKQRFREFINRNIHKNGKMVILSTSGVPIIDDEGNLLGYRGVDTDITERKQAEAELRINEERFRLIADNATDMISRIQVTPITRTDYVSPSCFRLTGYKQEEFYTDPNLGLEMLHPDDRDFFQKHLMSDSKKYHKPITIRLVRKDGRVVWIEQTHAIIFNENGEPVAMHLIARDITARKEAEEALRESEEKFSKAFRTSPNTMVITTLKDGKFIEVNDSYTLITGYTREETIGRSSKDINIWAKAEDRARMLKILKRKGRVDNEEFDFHIKSGEIRTWLFSAEPINIGCEPCIISMTTDITELKKAQEALSESEEFSTSLLENSPNPVLVIHPDTSVRYVNQAFENLTGFTLAEIADRKAPYPWWPEEERAEIGASLKETIAHGGRSRERVFQKKNGELFWVAISSISVMYKGKPKYLLINWVDITDRKQVEEVLRFSDAAFKSIHESVIALDTEDIITHWNDISEQMFSIKSSEALGKKFQDVIKVVDSRSSKFEEVLKILENQGYYQEEQLYRTKKGDVWVDVHIQDIVSDGKRYGRVILASDISHRKKAEGKLKKALSNLEHSSAQLAATNKELEAFSYSVSHDLRSPLRSIDGFSQALLEDYESQLDEDGQEYLRRLRGASQKMGELIDGILKLSRLSRSKMHKKQVNLSALVEEIIARLHENQPERDAEFVISKGLSDRGDPQLLRALFENLLGNAWKFTSKCERARIEFGTTQNGGKKTYFINDNGAGFDMTYADKLFSAFQRLHEATEYPGTGIGLATVQRIINRHGGSIWAEGALGKGATFYFTLN